MPDIIMYTTSTCPYCRGAKQLLNAKGISYTEIDVQSVDQKVAMINRSGRRTVPQIFFGDWHVGGFDDLVQLDREGGLAKALNPRLAG